MKKYIAHISCDREQTCTEHSRNVAQKASDSLSCIGLSNTAYLSGICHDIGKYTSEFQEYLNRAVKGEKVKRGEVIHSFAGVKIIMESFHPRFGGPCNTYTEGYTSEIISTAIASHHGLIDEIKDDGQSNLIYRCNKQNEYDNRAINTFKTECCSFSKIKSLFKNANKEIEKVVVKCHDMAKHNSKTPEQAFQFYLGLLQRMITSVVIDSDRTDTAEFMENKSYSRINNKFKSGIWNDAIISLEEKLDEFTSETEIQKARREMSDICAEFGKKPGGVYRLNIPTGGGKTLSGLRYALNHAVTHNKDRIIYTVPLLSVLDQNVDVIRNAVGRDDIILEHHSDVMTEELSEKENQLYDFLTETWSAPIIVTTLVQFLNTLFSGHTSSVRRFHSLCNSVVIIDEVQTIPDKMISLFNLAVNFLSKICGTTIILCSATQPNFEENYFNMIVDGDVIQFELHDKFGEIFKRTQTSYSGLMSEKEIAERAIELVGDTRNLLIVCNTKSEAKLIYQQISDFGIQCIYLSTSLCPAHRRVQIRNIAEMLKGEERFICVSTQLIEAGVDVSFAAVMRMLAGIDNIAQAAGRCNRHGEYGEISKVEVVSVKGEHLKFLKEIDEAKALTEGLVEEFLKNPDQFNNDLISSQAMNFYYKRKSAVLNSKERSTEYICGDGCTLLDLLAINKNACELKQEMRQAFKTAGKLFKVFDTNSRTVIVPYNDESKELINCLYNVDVDYEIGVLKEFIKSAKIYMVQLFDYQYHQLDKIGAIIKIKDGLISILQDGYYDSILGVLDAKDINANEMDEGYII